MTKTSVKIIFSVFCALALVFSVLGTAVSAASKSSSIVGDANCDGTVNLDDAISIALSDVGASALSAQGKKNADVNGDKKVDIKDALYVARKTANIIDKFPVEKDNELPPDEF